MAKGLKVVPVGVDPNIGEEPLDFPDKDTSGVAEPSLEFPDKANPVEEVYSQVSSVDPVRAARVATFAKTSDQPPEYINANLEKFEQAKKAPPTSVFDRIEKEYPGTREFLMKPENMALAHQNLEDVTKLEDHVKDHGFWSSVGSSIVHGSNKLAASLTKTPAALDDLAQSKFFIDPKRTAEGQGSNVKEIGEAQRRNLSTVLHNPAAQFLEKTAESYAVPELSDDISGEIGKGNYSKAGRALAMQLAANAPTTLAILAGAISGYGIPTMAMAGLTESAETTQKGLEAGVSDSNRQLNAAIHGSAEIAFESMGFFGMLKSWGSAIAKTHGKQVSREVLKDFGKSMFHSVMAEGSEEMATSFAQDLSDYGTGVNQQATEGIFGRALNAFILGGASGGMMSGPMIAATARSRQAMVRQAALDRDTFLAMGNTLESLKALENLGPAQQELVEKVTKGSLVENIYVPVQALETFFQSVNSNPVAAATELGIQEQYEAAKESGGDVKIPLALYAEKLVGQNFHTKLAKDIKFDPKGMTVNEATAQENESLAQLEGQALEAKKLTNEKLESEYKQIFEAEVASQVAAGIPEAEAKQNAAITAHRYIARAQNFENQSAPEMYHRDAAKVKVSDQEGPQGEAGAAQTFDQAARKLKPSPVADQLRESLGKDLNIEISEGKYYRDEYTYDEDGEGVPENFRTDAMIEVSISGERGKRAKKMGFDTRNAWFHGTRANIEAFSGDTLGESTGAGSAKMAHFFASSPSTASDYAEASDDALTLRSTKTEREAVRARDDFNGRMKKKHGPGWVSKLSEKERAERKKINQQFKQASEDFARSMDSSDHKVERLKYDIKEMENSLKHMELDLESGAVAKKNAEMQRVLDFAKVKAAAEWVANGSHYELVNKESGEKLVNPALKDKEDSKHRFYDFPQRNQEQIARLEERIRENTESNLKAEIKEAKESLKEMNDHLLKVLEGTEGQVVYPVVLKMKNPLIVDFKGAEYREITYREILEKAKEAGHDGVIFKNTYDPAFTGSMAGDPELMDVAAVFEPTQIRSVHARFDPKKAGSANILYQSAPNSAPPFYSKLTQTVEQKMGGSASPEQIKGMLKEIKPEEMKWLGLDEFLKGKEKVSKAELLDHLRANMLEIKEVTKNDDSGVTEEQIEEARMRAAEAAKERPYDPEKVRRLSQEFDDLKARSQTTKFSQYTLPGGENYREVLFTLPEKTSTELPEGFALKENPAKQAAEKNGSQWVVEGPRSTNGIDNRYASGRTPEEAIAKFHKTHGDSNGSYKSSHFEEPNVLAHTRLTDRTDADGKRVLHAEEIQSDWHQAGRKKGYKTDEATPKAAQDFFGITDESWEKKTDEEKQAYVDEMKEHREFKKGRVPDAPFRKTWHEFVMKRLIRMAAEGGYDKLTWSTGEQNADHYDLAKQVDEINYGKIKGDDTHVWVRVYGKNGDTLGLPFEIYKDDAHKVPKDKLEDVIGKEAAEKIIKNEGEKSKHGGRALREENLKVGGEGMKGFYDDMLVSYANKFGKKYGARVGEATLATDGKDLSQTDQDKALLADLHDKNITKVHALEITPALKTAALNEGFSLFQTAKEKVRGQIQFALDRKAVITLFQHKDVSTWAHESWHKYWDEMITDATTEGVSPQVVRDMDTALEWVGATVRVADGADAIRAGLTVEMQEQLARAGEAYLMEGKAPSEKLRKAFATFRLWLTKIYRSIQNLNVPMDDNIRQVMARMLAAEDEINIAYGEPHMEPLFKDPRAVGMSTELVYRYLNATAWAASEAKDRLAARLLRDLQHQQDKEYKKEKAAATERVEAELDKMPVYIAIRELTKRKVADGETKMRLSKVEVVAQFGQEAADKLKGMTTTKEHGLEPNLAAEMLGFPTGHEMITAISEAEPRQDMVDRLVEQEMNEKHPDLFKSPTLSEEALKEVHNEKRAELLLMEMEILFDQDKKSFKETMRRVARRVPTLKVVREQAARIMARRSVEDAKPHLFLRAEVRAANQAADLLAKGDFAGAFEAKNRELLNHELYRSAVDAQEQVEKGLEFFKKLNQTDEKISKSRDLDLVNAARAILTQFGLGRMGKPWTAYVEQMAAYDPDGYAVIESLIHAATENVGPYTEIKVEQFVTLFDTVQALWDLAKAQRQMDIDGKKVDREAIREELETQLESITKDDGRRAGMSKAVTKWEKTKMGLLGMRAALRRAEAWARAVDGGEAGPFTRYFIQPVMDATTLYRTTKKKEVQKFLDLIKPFSAQLKKRAIVAENLGYTFESKNELLGALLHTGNESNLQKLLVGRKWGSVDENGVLDSSRWDAFIAKLWKDGTLTKADYDIVQAVWDQMESVKPLAQKAHKKLYGYYFSEITAKAIETPFGTFRGGYMPAIADSDIVEDAAIREDKKAMEDGGNSFMFPQAGKGFTKKRVEGYNKPLSMRLDLVPGAIDKVLRFAILQPVVTDIARIVNHKDFRATLGNLDSQTASEMLIPWLQRTVLQATETPAQGKGGKLAANVARWARRRAGVLAMVGNFLNSAQNLTGVFPAAAMVKKGYLARGFAQALRSPQVTAALISERSAFMRERLERQTVELQGEIDEILVNPTKYESFNKAAIAYGYIPQKVTQNLVEMTSWIGAYDQAIAEGKEEIEAARFADGVVRQTQGTFNPEDISAYEMGPAWRKLFTQFYSYFNNQANLLGSEFALANQELDFGPKAGRMLYAYTMIVAAPAIVGAMIAMAFAGKIDDDDDGHYLDDIMALLFGSQFRYFLAMVPLGGQVIQGVANMFNDKRYDDKISISPAISMIERSAKGVASIYTAAKKNDSKQLKAGDALTALGLVSGLPTGLVSRPITYAKDVAERKARPANPLDYARGLVSGKPGAKH